MTTLAADKARISVLGTINELPVIASDIIYEGAAVGAVIGTGHVRPLTSVDKFVGFAERKCDNSTGAAAAKNVRVVESGKIVLSVSGAVITDIGQPVYATDDDTFVFLPTGGVYIGKVERFVSSGVVEVAYDAINGVDPYAGRVYETLAAATKTLDLEDSGKAIFCTVTTVITLAATAVDLDVKLVNMGPYGTVQISADPAAADKFVGPDLTGVDNKDYINTLATAQRGDFIAIKGGHADGYIINGKKGTWAAEA
jgi:hypothetical protein